MTTLPQTTSLQLPRPSSPAPIAPVSAPGPMALGAPGQMTGADVWRVMRTNSWIIVASLIFGLLFGFVLNWYLDTFHARYTAVGYVQIQPNRHIALGNKDDEMMGDPSQTLIVEQRTQSQILMTDSLFSQVLTNPNSEIQRTEWIKGFKNSDGSLNYPDAKEDLQRHFYAGPINESKLIAVQMTYKVPKDCYTIVMDIVGAHLENQRKQSTQKLVEQIDYLNTMRTRYETQIRELVLKNSKEAATLQLDGAGRPGSFGQRELELQTLTVQKLKEDDEANSAEAAYDGARQDVGTGATPGPVEMQMNNDWQILSLRQIISQLQIETGSNPYLGPESRYLQGARARLEIAEQVLKEKSTELRATMTDAYLSSLYGQAQARRRSVDAITKQIDAIKEQLANLGGKVADYLTRKDEEMALQELRRRADEQLQKLNVMQQQIDMNTVTWMSKPETPDIPSFPKLPITVSICVAAALCLSLGFSFLREVLDTSVRSPRDIARVGHMNLLGMIPHEDDDPQTQSVPLATVIYGAPGSMMAEQFRQVRTRLQHAASLDTTRSILVTSPGPADGKSVVACNLAAGLALNGRRILLVDANFRRPELHKLFGVGNESGLGNVLASVENFEACIHQTKVPNLDLMTTGPKPTNATELLESQLLIDFIERALEEYDHVIFDSGPMLFVSETVALAPRVDGVITVVRASTNSRGFLQRMRDALRQLKAEHLGIVLNGVRSTGGGYYGRNIKTYYEYQNGHPA